MNILFFSLGLLSFFFPMKFRKINLLLFQFEEKPLWMKSRSLESKNNASSSSAFENMNISDVETDLCIGLPRSQVQSYVEPTGSCFLIFQVSMGLAECFSRLSSCISNEIKQQYINKGCLLQFFCICRTEFFFFYQELSFFFLMLMACFLL